MNNFFKPGKKDRKSLEKALRDVLDRSPDMDESEKNELVKKLMQEMKYSGECK